jgi:hypothetical protein
LKRWKLAEKFASAEDAFAALDDDGGGELSRVELARGLRSARTYCFDCYDLVADSLTQVGIWMTPNELSEFVEALDQVSVRERIMCLARALCVECIEID